jgi:hypothetical protein
MFSLISHKRKNGESKAAIWSPTLVSLPLKLMPASDSGQTTVKSGESIKHLTVQIKLPLLSSRQIPSSNKHGDLLFDEVACAVAHQLLGIFNLFFSHISNEDL